MEIISMHKRDVRERESRERERDENQAYKCLLLYKNL